MITAGTGEKVLGIGAFRYWKPPLDVNYVIAGLYVSNPVKADASQ